MPILGKSVAGTRALQQLIINARQTANLCGSPTKLKDLKRGEM